MNPLEIPKLTQYINDFSGIFTPEERENLNKLFSEHDSKTTEQVVVVLIPHRKGNELLDIGLKVFNENGIGQKNLNNGLLLIISTEEKKLRVVTGKGMEIKYSEMVCRDIVENHLRPLLNDGKYEELIQKWSDVVNGGVDISQALPPKNIFYRYHYRGKKILKDLLLVLLVTIISLGTLFLLGSDKCSPNKDGMRICEKNILGYKIEYRIYSNSDIESSADNYSSYDNSSSSSFDGGGGSSNGGGYGD